MGLSYVGPAATDTHDLVTLEYIQKVFTSVNMLQSQVDSLINTGLSGFVTVAYLTALVANNADKSFVDAGDATRLKLAQIGQPNGIVPLDDNGKVPVANINMVANQRFPQPFYSPEDYNAANVAATGATAQTLYTCPVPDPGFTYKLLVFGEVDTETSLDGAFSRIWVAVGSPTGPMVAVGAGQAETYKVAAQTAFGSRSNADYSDLYTVPPGMVAGDKFDIVLVGPGGGGRDAAIPLVGGGGLHGAWYGITLTYGVDFPTSVTQFGITVGGGGPNNTTGHPTSVTVPGYVNSPLTAPGGGPGAQIIGMASVGESAPSVNFNGNTYPGGTGGNPAAGIDLLGHPASDAQGYGSGGGGGGLWFTVGGYGSSGAVWITAISEAAGGGMPRGPAAVVPYALNAQSALSGASTLYVRAQASTTTGNPTVTATTVKPNLWVCPIPVYPDGGISYPDTVRLAAHGQLVADAHQTDY